MLVKIRHFGQTSKIESLVKNQNFCQNPNVRQKSKFSQKWVQMLCVLIVNTPCTGQNDNPQIIFSSVFKNQKKIIFFRRLAS